MNQESQAILGWYMYTSVCSRFSVSSTPLDTFQSFLSCIIYWDRFYHFKYDHQNLENNTTLKFLEQAECRHSLIITRRPSRCDFTCVLHSHFDFTCVLIPISMYMLHAYYKFPFRFYMCITFPFRYYMCITFPFRYYMCITFIFRFYMCITFPFRYYMCITFVLWKFMCISCYYIYEWMNGKHSLWILECHHLAHVKLFVILSCWFSSWE